jgi:hypothetical protein
MKDVDWMHIARDWNQWYDLVNAITACNFLNN